MKAFKRMKEKGGRAYGFQQSLRKFGAPEEFVEGLSLIRFLHRLGQKIQLRIVHRDDIIFCGIPGEYKSLCHHWPIRGLPWDHNNTQMHPRDQLDGRV